MKNNFNPFNNQFPQAFPSSNNHSFGGELTVNKFLKKSLNLTIKKNPTTTFPLSKNGQKMATSDKSKLYLANHLFQPQSFTRFEMLLNALKKIAVLPNHSGIIDMQDISLPMSQAISCLNDCHRAGMLNYQYCGNTQIKVTINPAAIDFISKDGAVLYLVDYLITHNNYNEIYYKVPLTELNNFSPDTYNIDIVTRKLNNVRFISLALNPNLLNNTNQLLRLAKMADRLGSLTVIISPNLNTISFRNILLQYCSNKSVPVHVFDYNHLNMLLI